MNVKEYLQNVKNGDIDVVDYISKAIEEVKKINKEYNYFNFNSEELALKQANEVKRRIRKNDKGKLLGLPISAKDCICVKDVESRAGSRILTGYKPVFNATVIERIIKEGGIIIGKTSQDEFGFGSFSINTNNIPKNPFDKSRVCGGSSGGAAGITQKLDKVHVALAESTGGSIANPAGFCGVIGFTPTYGVVSRYGLIDYANSLDKIGVVGKNIEDCKIVFDAIKGYDEKDSTSLKKELNKVKKIKKIGVIKESLNVDKDIKDIVLSKLDNYDIVSLPLTERYSLASYYLIAMSEASTNLAKYSGMRYGAEEKLDGNYNEYFSNVRSKYFGKEAKRRIILGTFARMAGYRDAFYLRAMKVRSLIINEYKKMFKRYDVLVSPTMPITAPKFDECSELTPLQNYMMDILTVGPNLAGLPHISLNAGYKDKMPVGIMFIGDHLDDDLLQKL